LKEPSSERYGPIFLLKECDRELPHVFHILTESCLSTPLIARFVSVHHEAHMTSYLFPSSRTYHRTWIIAESHLFVGADPCVCPVRLPGPRSGNQLPSSRTPIREPGFLDPGFHRNDEEASTTHTDISRPGPRLYLFRPLGSVVPKAGQKVVHGQTCRAPVGTSCNRVDRCKTNWVGFRVLVRTSSVHDQ